MAKKIAAALDNNGDVYYNGEKITDFEIKIIDGEKYGLVLNKNGRIMIERKKTGSVKFRVYYNGMYADFTWSVK